MTPGSDLMFDFTEQSVPAASPSSPASVTLAVVRCLARFFFDLAG